MLSAGYENDLMSGVPDAATAANGGEVPIDGTVEGARPGPEVRAAHVGSGGAAAATLREGAARDDVAISPDA